MGCPICGHELEHTDNSVLPITSTCKTGCQQYIMHDQGMGDGWAVLDGKDYWFDPNKWYVDREGQQKLFDTYNQHIEELKGKWENGIRTRV